MAVPQRIGRYQIAAEIGSGGFARVYSAQDPSVGRTVAIKVMNAPGDPDLVRRFRSEALTTTMLTHKNIVTIYDYGEHEGAPYLVMEYLEGVNLQNLIKLGALSLFEKIEIMIEVAEGLYCAHRQGITHRDVKPANIMRLADGSVKIMDFGIARIARETANRLTQTGFIVGTWSYMAPEQFNGISDPQSDIFAYGVTFYELLTGRNPFNAPDPASVFARITGSEPAPIGTLLPACPEDLDRLVHKALAKDRGARYAHLQDLIIDAKPILMELGRNEANEVYAKAGQLLGSGQLDAAQSAVRQSLELDPTHTGSRQLRAQIEKEVQRRDLTAKAGALLEKAEKELRENQFDEASETLAAARPLVSGDSRFHARLVRVDAQVEEARRVARLLETARDNLRSLDYTEAFRSVTEALTSDPGNDTGKALLEEIHSGMTLRETKRRIQEALTRIEGLLLTGETEHALAALCELERDNPGVPEVTLLLRRAEAQRSEEIRCQKLADGLAECKTLLRNRQFADAIGKANLLLADFPESTELRNLLRHATEREAARSRTEQIECLKAETAGLLSRREFDSAIGLLETGVANFGDDVELTHLLQDAIAGREVNERERLLREAGEEARRLRDEGKYDEALAVAERATLMFRGAVEPKTLAQEIAAERRDRAIEEAVRHARGALDRNEPEAALPSLRECLAQYGEDAGVRRLLETAEAQILERERNLRAQSVQTNAPAHGVEHERENEIENTAIGAQPAREQGLSEAATEILNSAFIAHGRSAPQLQEQERLAESLAEEQCFHEEERDEIEARPSLTGQGTNPDSAAELRPEASRGPSIETAPARTGSGRKKLYVLLGAVAALILVGVLWRLPQRTPPSIKQAVAPHAPAETVPSSTGEHAGKVQQPQERAAAVPAAFPGAASAAVVIKTPRVVAATDHKQAGQTAPQLAAGPAIPPTPEPRQCKAFDWASYGDITSGDLTWNGDLSGNGQITIRGRTVSDGKVRGDALRKSLPVSVTIAPDTVVKVSGPSQADCYDAPLVLRNAGPAVQSISIHWEAAR